MESKAITTRAVKAAPTQELAAVDTFISQAIEKGASVETLERLFDLQQKARAAAAKQQFIKALAKFQSECPVIEKKKIVYEYDGRTIRYRFAPIDSIVDQIKEALGHNGLSYRWEVETKDENIIATCIVTHVAGHSETSSFSAPIGEKKLSKSGNELMTAPQRAATSLTYPKRYSLCNALGIATGDEDTDATDAGKDSKDAKDPKAKIVLRLRTLGEKTGTREQIGEAVKRLTQLELAEGNFDEIVTRLEVIISERNGAAGE